MWETSRWCRWWVWWRREPCRLLGDHSSFSQACRLAPTSTRPYCPHVIILDPIISGDEHVSFNAGLICIAAMASPEPVVVWADPAHFALVRALLPTGVAERVSFFASPPPSRRLTYATRGMGDAAIAWRRIRRAATLGAQHVLVACAFPGTLIGIKAAMATIPRRRRPTVHAVVHGALQDAWGWRSRRPIQRLLDMTSALRWPAPAGFRLVLLEKGIADNLAAKLPRIADQLLVLELPIIEAMPTSRGPRQAGPLRVGFLGRANREKGFDRFCELARAVTARGANVEFHAIGQAKAGDFSATELAPLTTTPDAAPLDRATFLDRLHNLDLVVMLHDPAHYTYAPSGVLLDAVAAGRPVLCVDDAIVHSLVARHGPIGPQLPDLDAATEFLAELDLTALDQPDFLTWRDNAHRAAESRRPAALAVGYAQELAR